MGALLEQGLWYTGEQASVSVLQHRGEGAEAARVAAAQKAVEAEVFAAVPPSHTGNEARAARSQAPGKGAAAAVPAPLSLGTGADQCAKMERCSPICPAPETFDAEAVPILYLY
eukprot:TRINITY_DN12137_c0_g1_i1.p4 TRINITY_DN12137_c0_g1~~TRINITY_DN12137_c0_g1_i1.p4  ORF type:complete len:114 (+),score=4.71 TRINITY_DN12137_c0_g1_i1:331-672(+)